MNYKIVWFENDASYVESLKPRIESYLGELGFILKLDVQKTGKELDKFIRDKDADLILMDFMLSEDDKGDMLIEKIRSNDLYTEIIFYSEYKQFKDKIVEIMGLPEGIFFVNGRKDLFDKIKKIINLTLNKTQDVNNLRGLVIAETIDLEVKMDEIIIKYFELSEVEKIEIFKERVLGPEFFTTTKKFHLINRICKEKIKILNIKLEAKLPEKEKKELKEKKEILTGLKEEFQKIEDEVIKIRNTLAHVKESDIEKNTLKSTLSGYSSIIVDDEWCNKTRCNLKKHSENLGKIISHV